MLIRHDIMYAVSMISKFMYYSIEIHLLEKSNLYDFTNSNYAWNLDDRKSKFRYVFTLGTWGIL